MSNIDNVVGAVTDAISASNPAAAIRFARSFHCDSKDPHQQVVELNRYWRDELSRLHISTISARSCLIDRIEPTDWLRHFKGMVLEQILANDLPQRG